MNRGEVEEKNHPGNFIGTLVPNFGLLDNPLQQVVLHQKQSDKY